MDTNKIFIDMAQRAHEFAEMCRLMQKIPDMPLTAEVKDALDEYAKRLGLPKADPEAWREENRKKQADGVRFAVKTISGEWVLNHKQVSSISDNHVVGVDFTFEGNKEDYREVPQAVSASECQKALEHLARTYSADKGTAQLNPTIPPHAAERALWKAQREAGTNEAWISTRVSNGATCEIPAGIEPGWHDGHVYRVKPMKLTAKIIRREFYPRMAQPACLVQNWEFAGTREEYRAECEKYGYVVISEIKEVKPKTVKYYFALMKNSAGEISVKWCDESNLSALEKMGSGWGGHTIIGDIEEREVEA